MLSAAVAVTLTLPATVALFAGAVTDTVGAVVSGVARRTILACDGTPSLLTKKIM